MTQASLPKDPNALRVMIVDDSASIRAAFSSIIAADPGLSLMGAAPDPFAAVEMMRAEIPDVMLLDLELPKMDGLTFLKKIMSQRPIPVVVCSSHAGSGSEAMMKALDLGAAEVLEKPKLDGLVQRQEAAVRIGDALRAAVQSRARLPGLRKPQRAAASLAPGEKLLADVILPPLPPRAVPTTPPVIVIGASTGGIEALKDLLTVLPEATPPVIIVQHMPEHFTAAFAKRLNTLCRVTVSEAKDGDILQQGHVYIAPGNYHMLLRRSSMQYRIAIQDGPCVSRHRPSVDVVFRSAAQAAGANAMGIIMTGMGDDGARCLAEMRAAGAFTLAQDEASCVVYGMPGEAVARGGVAKIVPLGRIAAEIAGFSELRTAAAKDRA
ncbi:protein-glutamate methylesterase/protein-glutamine glutaminase [Rhodobacter ferrooxidans]|uniref:Protein-glutamate methylesterase/protein-glutamine glutaminase n=1 Tax=Rhodobacter ferrooxidans TaxID=371731 RepID=C8S4H0_9RHOB|nr:chemotaxis response regulator protein-glutamate methylesterase [Rhodobacter sp. SW2]EEW24137.1 response regulator receiver modulated CheB methylesterase [Rhodobacter sp. SW2]